MYVPPHAREERADVESQAIDEIGFGTLVTVAHGTIVRHVSKANEQGKAATGRHAVAAFVGPQLYVWPALRLRSLRELRSA